MVVHQNCSWAGKVGGKRVAGWWFKQDPCIYERLHYIASSSGSLAAIWRPPERCPWRSPPCGRAAERAAGGLTERLQDQQDSPILTGNDYYVRTPLVLAEQRVDVAGRYATAAAILTVPSPTLLAEMQT